MGKVSRISLTPDLSTLTGGHLEYPELLPLLRSGLKLGQAIFSMLNVSYDYLTPDPSRWEINTHSDGSGLKLQTIGAVSLVELTTIITCYCLFTGTTEIK